MITQRENYRRGKKRRCYCQSFFPILPGAVFDDCVMMRKNGAKLTGGGGGRTLSEVQLSQEINYSMEDLVHIQSNQKIGAFF